jgi:hypothetical protein
MGALYSGGQAYFLRLWLIAFISQFMLDRYLGSHKQQELWQPARYYYTSGLDYDIHDPYTDTYNNIMVRNWRAPLGFGAISPDHKHLMTAL